MHIAQSRSFAGTLFSYTTQDTPGFTVGNSEIEFTKIDQIDSVVEKIALIRCSPTE